MIDLTTEVASYEAAHALAAQDEATKRVFLVCPACEEAPADGVLSYVTVESIYDVKDTPDRSVMMFADPAVPVLALLAANQGLFEVELRYLSGVPGASYTHAFDSAAWNLERVAYATLVSDLRAAADHEQQLRAQNMSVHDRERKQVARADGTVKPFKGYIGPDGTSPEDGDDADVALDEVRI